MPLSPRPPAARLPSDERATAASPGGPARNWSGPLARPGALTHLIAGAVLVGCAIGLFRLSLFEGWTFLGDSDRLNTVLNVRLFELQWLRERGSIPTWDERQFMGYSIVGLHWMLPGAPPLPQLLALLPAGSLYTALSALATALLAAAMLAAYWSLGPYSAGPIQRIVGALLYGTGLYTIHKLAQLDLSFAALIAPPLFVGLVRRCRRESAATTYLAMAGCWGFLVVFTVLQEIAYVAILWGAYAVYLTVRRRDPWPLVASGIAFVAGVAVGIPRIVTIAAEIPFVTRTSSNLQTTAAEALRFFGDGLLGRSMTEHALLGGSTINLHEGVQLLNSPLAAWAVVALGLSLPTRRLRCWGVALAVVLSVALNAYARPFYELDALGLRGAAYPSRELRTVAINAALLGVALGGLAAWRAVRARRRPSGAGAPTDAAVQPPGVAEDLPFLFGFVVVGLALILIPEARLLLYHGFMRMDFLHSRLSVALTLPLAALVVVLLNRLLPPSPPRTSLLLGVGLGLALWCGRETVAGAAAAQLGPAVDALRPRRLLAEEVVRVVSSLVVLVAALAAAGRLAAPSARSVVGAFLCAWICLEAVSSADHRLGGPPATQQQRPFSNLDYYQVPPGAMRIPSEAERAAVRGRLEADRYRVVLLQDRETFGPLVEPHLSAFWDLRLVEGYSTGLPRRLAALPWPASTATSHALDLSTTTRPTDLPWRLLGALNVKYAVRVDRSLWFNPGPGGADPPLDPARIAVFENPHAVLPRVFFAARVAPAGPVPSLPEDPAQLSVAEGLDGERPFAVGGQIEATFAGDRIEIAVDPATADRFVVLNELYHPSWRAWVDGAPATVYPTNLVMRGIVVPAGARLVELRFEPFIASPAGGSAMAAAVAVSVVVAGGLARIDLVRRRPFVVARRRTGR